MLRTIYTTYLTSIALIAACLFITTPSLAAGAMVVSNKPIAVGIREELAAGRAQDVIVEFESAGVDEAAAQLRSQLQVSFSSQHITDLRAQRYEAAKTRVLAGLASKQYQRITRYTHLPLELLRLHNTSTLQALLDNVAVKAIYLDEVKYPVIDSGSTSLINLPAAQTLGLTGTGTTVAVIDSGVTYTQADFGCTAPATPVATCKVSFYHNFADSSTTLDAIGHGTNVSGIVVGVAPNTHIAALNVFGAGSTTSDSRVLSAINWVLANQASFNIVAVNMSLGDSVNHGAGCVGTAYDTPVAQLLTLGVEVYVASGNNGFNSGVSSPACVPGVNAVGAVYTNDIGTAAWSTCTDSSTMADQITCFSNLPPTSGTLAYKFLMAPGVNITAGGFIGSGTSQATPFVAGAQALIAAAIPQNFPTAFNRAGQSPGYYFNFANGIAKPITRTGYFATLKRLDLANSLNTSGDNFSNALQLPLIANNIAATKESGEPNHAGNAGGKSVWGQWTAPYTGSIQIDTHGSGFDTLLGVYTGLTVASLTQVVSNDDDGSSNGNSSVVFQAQAGTQYRIAVDGKNGASGVLGMLFAVPNDNFVARTALVGLSGSLLASNWFATAESGEAVHAGHTAQQSVWWKWLAPASGQVTLDTHGSGFDTVLDVVTGNSVAATTPVISNDNDGSANNASGVVFNANSGTEYNIAVDGKGSIGQIVLNWSLVTTVNADLSVTFSASSAMPGNAFNYVATLTNNGPATATNTHLVFALPSGVTYNSATRSDGGSLACNAIGQTVTCIVGTLYNNASVTILLNATASAVGNYSASVTASSTLADATNNNNSATATALVNVDSADAPTLPQWAAIILGVLLLQAAGVSSRKHAKRRTTLLTP